MPITIFWCICQPSKYGQVGYPRRVDPLVKSYDQMKNNGLHKHELSKIGVFVKPLNVHHVKVIDWDEEDSNGKGGQVSGMSEVIRERRL